MSNWWNEVYRKPEEIPWDIDVPSEELVELIGKGEIKPCPALDVCCGTGTEAIYLVKNGFKVSAIDISKEAIEIAEKKAEEAKVKVDFRVGNVLELPFQDNSFGFVNDRGCFHVFAPEYREWFADEIHRVMKPRGIYLLRCFSDKEPCSWGPYRISKQEITRTFSNFEVGIEDIKLQGKKGAHRGYRCVMKKLQ
ncbi:MAG: class I SAM-dependent methyltransferase [Candidatus Hydrothermarchaeota archaeon]|nr:class I SAM-dependent methyltransferase [Candidatus Hydrothermarchaeota archaeon]